MPAATPKEAVEEFLRPLRQVVSCVSRGVLNVRGGYHPSDRPHSVIIGGGLPVGLPSPGRLSLRMVHHYRVLEDPGDRGSWKVRTAAYYYSLDDSAIRKLGWANQKSFEKEIVKVVNNYRKKFVW